MRPDHWERVEQLCQEALERPQEHQAAFVESACGEDQELRRQVESLLAHRQRAEGFMEVPAMQMAARALAAEQVNSAGENSRQIGRIISHYRIVEKIASGGMGDIYRAIRADGTYEKQVAIKLIQGARSTDFFLARFQNERQILADLDHSNIARLLDGGTTEEGLPYLVMEYVAGLPIDEFCRQKALRVRERLELFLKVCSAVQYAHQNLVVHRDLKPSNILVTTDGVPKLLDFGVAKILNPQRGEKDLQQTLTILRMLTPDYASPEQVRNELISTASDVYSLGVILYVILTGRRPYRTNPDSPQEMMNAICETEPEKPSSAVMLRGAPQPTRRQQFGASESSPPMMDERPEKLRKVLAGDLDNIVLKALRKDPRWRYSSVEQFSEDIRRYLTGLPVLAYKDTLSYRGRKFIGRHKLGVAAASLVFISIAGGLVATLWQARIARANELRAERRFNDVRALANSLMFEVHDSIRDLAGATQARKLLVSKALQYLDSLSREAAGDASLQRELAAAYEKVGEVQGNPFAANLGDPAGALASYRKALAIRESLAVPDSEESRRNLANDYEWVGMALESLRDYRGALEYYRKDFTIKEALTKTAPSARSQERLAGAYFLIAHCYAALQDPKSALENYQKSAAIRETIVAESPFVQSRLAGTYGYMADVLWSLGELGEATKFQRRALEITKKLADANPASVSNREYADEAYYWVGFYLEREGDVSQALVNYRRALADFQAVASADPKEVLTKEYVVRCYKGIGTALVAEGKVTHGLRSIRAALSIAEELPAPENTEDVADAYGAMGLAYAHLATEPGSSKASSEANWKKSQEAYERSLNNWLAVKDRGALTLFEAGEPDRIKKELAECHAALAGLRRQFPSRETTQKSGHYSF
jgi:serine/threonine protein kinase/tetratricopeptide (TPR) repeat protein